jgi:hypothetical protein
MSRLIDYHAVFVSVNPPINFYISEPVFMKHAMYIMESEPQHTS